MIPNVSPQRIATLRARFATDERSEAMAETFGLLSNPLRLQIVRLLTEEDELCVTELAAITDYGMSAISHALRPLRQAGIVATHKVGRQVCYRLTDRERITRLVSERRPGLLRR